MYYSNMRKQRYKQVCFGSLDVYAKKTHKSPGQNVVYNKLAGRERPCESSLLSGSFQIKFLSFLRLTHSLNLQGSTHECGWSYGSIVKTTSSLHEETRSAFLIPNWRRAAASGYDFEDQREEFLMNKMEWDLTSDSHTDRKCCLHSPADIKAKDSEWWRSYRG